MLARPIFRLRLELRILFIRFTNPPFSGIGTWAECSGTVSNRGCNPRTPTAWSDKCLTSSKSSRFQPKMEALRQMFQTCKLLNYLDLRRHLNGLWRGLIERPNRPSSPSIPARISPQNQARILVWGSAQNVSKIRHRAATKWHSTVFRNAPVGVGSRAPRRVNFLPTSPSDSVRCEPPQKRKCIASPPSPRRSAATAW